MQYTVRLFVDSYRKALETLPSGPVIVSQHWDRYSTLVEIAAKSERHAVRKACDHAREFFPVVYYRADLPDVWELVPTAVIARN
jgi:hypothetical protein